MDSSAVPKVSVIIPLYNKAPYIKRALDSVFAQTVQDFEIVVVGGNSTDGGEDIVLGYSDPRIRFVKEAGKGVSAARNQGVDAARAELVAFLDADDEWLPEFLETILRLREKWPEAGMYGTGYLRHGLKNSWNCYDIQLSGDITERYFEYIVHYPEIIKTSSSAYDRKIYQLFGGFPVGYPWNEDAALFTQFAIESSVVYCPRICAIYYDGMLNNTAIPTQFQENPLIEYIQSLQKNIIESRQDIEQLKIYCELTRKAGYMRNYSIGYVSQSKHQLSQSFHEAYRMDLICMRTVSMIPDSIINFFQKTPKRKKIFMQIINHIVSIPPYIYRKYIIQI